ncbi:amidohydrolase family protein [Clostridium senegalense]
MKAIINAKIYDFNNFIENGYVIFDDKIIEVGNMTNFNRDDIEIIDCKNSIVMPGLVNGHTHILPEISKELSIWNEFKNKGCYYNGLMFGIECIKNGVTTIIDHSSEEYNCLGTLNELKKAICDSLSLRGIFSFSTSEDLNIDNCIKENIDFLTNSSENYTGLFGLNSSMKLSDETLKKIESYKNHTPIHIHIAETIDDVADCMSKYEKRIIERLNDWDLLTDNSLLAHCVYVSDREAQLLNEKNIYVAVTPTSNMNKGLASFNYSMFEKYNIPCIIGTDGLSANITRDFSNLVYTMRSKYNNSNSFTLNDLVKVIKNNYEYANKILNIKIGKIEKNYKSDLIIIPYKEIVPLDEENILNYIFYAVFDSFSPKDVICDGKFLMKDYKVLYENEKLYEEPLKVRS